MLQYMLCHGMVSASTELVHVVTDWTEPNSKNAKAQEAVVAVVRTSAELYCRTIHGTDIFTDIKKETNKYPLTVSKVIPWIVWDILSQHIIAICYTWDLLWQMNWYELMYWFWYGSYDPRSPGHQLSSWGCVPGGFRKKPHKKCLDRGPSR